MKLLIAPFLLVGFICTAQDLHHYRFAVGMGIGSYSMKDLKGFEQYQTVPGLPRPVLKNTDNFPAYYFYSAEVSRLLFKKIWIGLAYRLQSTGYKSSYEDYSGYLQIENIVRSDNAGFIFGVPLVKLNRFQFSVDCRLYYTWTQSTPSIDLEIFKQQIEPVGYYPSSVTLKSKNITVVPGVDFSYAIFDRISVGVSAGYCYDFKGELKYNSGDDAYLKSDWSGLRIGLSTYYSFW